MGDPRSAQEKWESDIAPYVKRGLKCALWGHSARNMTKKELLGFVGFLDEIATYRQRQLEAKQGG